MDISKPLTAMFNPQQPDFTGFFAMIFFTSISYVMNFIHFSGINELLQAVLLIAQITAAAITIYIGIITHREKKTKDTGLDR